MVVDVEWLLGGLWGLVGGGGAQDLWIVDSQHTATISAKKIENARETKEGNSIQQRQYQI